MGWFRSRSRLGSYLALFALTFQLAVSFGHVHLDHIAPVPAGATVLASAQPSSDKVILGRLRLEAAVEFDLTASHSALFQARAPPLA